MFMMSSFGPCNLALQPDPMMWFSALFGCRLLSMRRLALLPSLLLLLLRCGRAAPLQTCSRGQTRCVNANDLGLSHKSKLRPPTEAETTSSDTGKRLGLSHRQVLELYGGGLQWSTIDGTCMYGHTSVDKVSVVDPPSGRHCYSASCEVDWHVCTCMGRAAAASLTVSDDVLEFETGLLSPEVFFGFAVVVLSLAALGQLAWHQWLRRPAGYGCSNHVESQLCQLVSCCCCGALCLGKQPGDPQWTQPIGVAANRAPPRKHAFAGTQCVSMRPQPLFLLPTPRPDSRLATTCPPCFKVAEEAALEIARFLQ